MIAYPLNIVQMRNGVWEKVGVVSIEDQIGFWKKHQ